MKVEQENNIKTYSRIRDRAGSTKYIVSQILQEIEWIPVIGNLCRNCILQVHNILNTRSKLLTIQIQLPCFDKQMTKAIKEGTALVASDGLVKEQYIRSY